MGSEKGTTKSGGQKDILDKFYTKFEVAEDLIQKVGLEDFQTRIEPSAGSGAFSSQIDKCIALDLKPEGEGIIEQDFFTYSYTRTDPEEKVLVIGNPPFGQQNSLAVGFINHAAAFADRIAFVLPVSFKKESVQNRINPNFHLIYEEDLPKNSFTFNGVDYDVKCVFQIWDKQNTPRQKSSNEGLNTNNLFDYVKKSDAPDAAIQRVGGNAGKATASWSGRSEASNYFIRIKPNITGTVETLIEQLNRISYPSRDHAVGPRSISKRELNTEINKLF